MLLLQQLLSSISITFFSMVIGVAINELIKKKEFYKSISNLTFIKNDLIYKLIGVKYMKWLVYKTFWRNVNTKLIVKKRPSLIELDLLKQEMIYAEISHLIAFVFTLLISLIILIFGTFEFGALLMSVNIFFNLYPALLQQKNKERVNRLIDAITN